VQKYFQDSKNNFIVTPILIHLDFYGQLFLETNDFHFALGAILFQIHKKQSSPFPPPHIATIIQFDYNLITFHHFKFSSRLLH